MRANSFIEISVRRFSTATMLSLFVIGSSGVQAAKAAATESASMLATEGSGPVEGSGPMEGSEDLEPALDARLQTLVDWLNENWARQAHAGLTVGISFPGLRWVQGFGMADLRKQRAATAQTSYRLASITKTFTAVAIMQLEERGRLSLGDDVRRFLPTFPKKSSPVTIHDLLGHLSGVGHYQNLSRETHFKTHYTTQQALAVFQDRPLQAVPKERYLYTSYGYNLLGAVVEARSGLSYNRYLKRNLFAPLGIKSAGVEQKERRTKHWARGYKLRKGKLVRSEEIDISSRFAGGGTRANIDELLRFGEGLLADKLLKPASFKRMQEPMATSAGEVTDYGMGMASYPLSGRWVLAHAGSQNETSTLLMLFPAEALVIAIAQNLENQWTENQAIAGRIAEIFLANGERRRGWAGRNLADHLLTAGLTRVFSHGLGSYRRASGRIDDGPGDLLRAFRVVNRLLRGQALALDAQHGWDAIQLALGPKTERALPKVGAFMAAIIASHLGGERVRGYGPADTFTFLQDYVAACRALDCPSGFQLSEEIQSFVNMVRPSIASAYPEPWRQRRVQPDDDAATIGAELRQAFGSARVVPDFAGELRDLGSRRLKAGEFDKAQPWLELAQSLYPQDARSAVELALLRYARGDASAGDALLREVAKLPGADDRLKPARLRFSAWQLEGIGAAAGGRALVAFAARYHGDNVGLWELLAKKSEALHDPAGALEALRRAESLAPAKRRRARIERLTTTISP